MIIQPGLPIGHEASIDGEETLLPAVHMGPLVGAAVVAVVVAHDSGEGRGRGRRFKHCPFSAL